MVNGKYWVASLLGTSMIVVSACGGSSDSDNNDNAGGTSATGGSVASTGGTSTGSGGGPGTGGAPAETGGAPAAGAGGTPGTGGMPPVVCGGTECPVQVPGTCCIGSLCGVTDMMTGECVDLLADLRDGGAEIEPIVTDPACGMIEFSFLGTPVSLPGCCDATGVCGGNTGELPDLAGLSLPTLCLTPAEGAQLLLVGPADVPCGPDAGVPPIADASPDAPPTPPSDAGGDSAPAP